MRRPTVPRPVALAVASVLGSGCMTLGPVAPVQTSGGYAYEDAWGTQGFAAPPGEVREAVVGGMADLRMRGAHRSGQKGESVEVLDGQAHDGRHVRVVLRPRPGETIVNVRVGRFGDEALAHALIERVGVRLGTLAPAPAPEAPPTSPTPWRRLFSKEAVADEIMLRDAANAGYRDTPTP